MKLTIHRGTKEIGGNCIELTSPTGRIVLDLGMPLFDANREPFETKELEGKSIAELLQSGILPQINGLFEEGTPPDAILLSHSHLDHVGLLPFSRPEVPVYATVGTSKMMLAGALFSRQNQLDPNRFQPLKSGQTRTIKDFTITPYAVDHSAYGSLALLIETEGKRILYSGDLRRHGRKPEVMQKFVEVAAKKEIDLLLIEGTHMGSARQTGIDEFMLEDQLVKHLSGHSELLLGYFSPMDVDRLQSYWNASKRIGRTFVADVYAAFVMHLVAGDQGLPNPFTEPGIRIFYPQFFDKKPAWKKPGKLLPKFESKRIQIEEILAEPSRYLMVFRPSMLDSDFAGQLPTGACCTYSSWAGYLENDDWKLVQQRLAEVHGTFIQAHTSGHIYLDDLRQLIESLHPKTVVPIHTFEPQLFKQWFENVRCLNDGETVGV